MIILDMFSKILSWSKSNDIHDVSDIIKVFCFFAQQKLLIETQQN